MHLYDESKKTNYSAYKLSEIGGKVHLRFINVGDNCKFGFVRSSHFLCIFNTEIKVTNKRWEYAPLIREKCLQNEGNNEPLLFVKSNHVGNHF